MFESFLLNGFNLLLNNGVILTELRLVFNPRVILLECLFQGFLCKEEFIAGKNMNYQYYKDYDGHVDNDIDDNDDTRVLLLVCI